MIKPECGTLTKSLLWGGGGGVKKGTGPLHDCAVRVLNIMANTIVIRSNKATVCVCVCVYSMHVVDKRVLLRSCLSLYSYVAMF